MSEHACDPWLPQPRGPVADPSLARPDWTKGAPRDPARLWLDKNENWDPELNAVVAAVMRALPDEAWCTYPEAAGLYAKLAKWVGVEPGNLILGAGSDGIIRAVFEAYVGEGDTVIHTIPTFAMYSVYSRMYGARVVGLDYRPSDAGPQLDPQRVVDAIVESRPKLVCLPNPDSPTGTVVARDDLRRIVEAAGAVGALMLVDEAYFPFLPDTVVPWIAHYPHLVVCRSTGKAWGMAGLRIGYGVASPQVAAILHKVRPMYECSTVAVHAFERLLDHVDAMEASVRRLQDGKARFLAAMGELDFRTLNGAGNFLHVAFGDQAQAVHRALDGKVMYRQYFADSCLAGFSRFSATTPQAFAPVIDLIRKAVKGNAP
ncbi:pyridoxal phosphate-dependent aminotransferase [Magnetospirillum gryphiswaldense]|uniref:Aminotransferase n=1 Tax=Magnetospirillum gryphiswaldense TaxID=55518 RepID=A4U166_9PROT|nr:aminotransferase class I/II-fold pyridoxal phosphate-dependent enzyme [Magnetospirillum gryphiswaldense]AVM75596.1 Histidinol-phosphate aminotransferase [Magnetospirillum gryphiswaldense MSR-1]AVM79499.1 Histidinol-phosphate aminotransferase [Magnetospirillum gryphiswaldense]CAM76623.1 Histidinol-phosphate/aromatic aminotransferase [Magnetospirillum gryphiswaldense MSR-1]